MPRKVWACSKLLPSRCSEYSCVVHGCTIIVKARLPCSAEDSPNRQPQRAPSSTPSETPSHTKWTSVVANHANLKASATLHSLLCLNYKLRLALCLDVCLGKVRIEVAGLLAGFDNGKRQVNGSQVGLAVLVRLGKSTQLFGSVGIASKPQEDLPTSIQ